MNSSSAQPKAPATRHRAMGVEAGLGLVGVTELMDRRGLGKVSGEKGREQARLRRRLVVIVGRGIAVQVILKRMALPLEGVGKR